jgi:hypothetical protein
MIELLAENACCMGICLGSVAAGLVAGVFAYLRWKMAKEMV